VQHSVHTLSPDGLAALVERELRLSDPRRVRAKERLEVVARSLRSLALAGSTPVATRPTKRKSQMSAARPRRAPRPRAKSFIGKVVPRGESKKRPLRRSNFYEPSVDWIEEAPRATKPSVG